ncbi:substrate-binding periplasmic protein [Marinobacter sp. C2H3]|uniref:substrate-binding periplasmic protein n=1 Tax=Marinobacter sp. C2H3 TaxID=3119003 RepID=UPI00300E950F
MRISLLIIGALWSVSAWCQTLQIMGSDEGFIPFYYGHNLSEGILVEVIHEFTRETGIAGRFRPVPRKRQAWTLKQGRANAVFANPLWMPLPDQMHAVGPVLTWRDRVFAQPGRRPERFEDLQGSVCLRKWFVYSDALEQRIDAGLVRRDGYNAQQMLGMFLSKRCDYIVMNDVEFRFLARQINVDPSRFHTGLIDTEWPVYLGILKTETTLIDAAEAFFAAHNVDVEALVESLPPPDRPVSIRVDH